MTIPTDSELAQAYSQGYQDGRRAGGVDARIADRHLITKLSTALHAVTAMLDNRYHATVSYAMAQEAMTAESMWRVADKPQPATKGE